MDTVPVGAMEDLKKLGSIILRRSSKNEYNRFLDIQEECRFKWQATVDKLIQLRKRNEEYTTENAELRAELKHISGLWMLENQERRKAEKERDYYKTKMEQTYMFLRPNYTAQSIENRVNNTYCINNDQSSDEITSTASFLSKLSDVSSSQYEHRRFETSQKSQLSDELNAIFGITSAQTHDVEKEMNFSNNVSQRPRSHLADKTLQANSQPNKMHTEVLRNKVNVKSPDSYIVKADRQRLRSPTKQTTSVSHLAGKENRQLRKQHSISDIDSNPIYERIDNDSMLFEYDNNDQPNFEKLSGSIAEKPSENLLFFQLDTNLEQVIDPHKCQHTFSHRTASRSVVCFLCTKKFRFGILAYKCKSCNIFVHHDCKTQMKIAAKTRWSMIHANGYSLSDYVTSDTPSVPELIVHCVNEVETRGLSEKGIYRVSGSEKEIQTLKDKFILNKGVPDISNVDMHVICGCIKTFLRGLREPLIPTSQWTNFANFVIEFDSDSKDGNIMKKLQSAVGLLPKANRDTLAFLVLHLQRVAISTAVQMPISNLAKVFGPTVVGYSKPKPDLATILGETVIQQKVMEHFLHIHQDYWFSFIGEDLASK